MSVTINVAVTGLDETTATVQGIIRQLSTRKGLHMEIAREASDKTKLHLEGNNNHRTAQKLGANPTGFRKQNAQRVQPDWDEQAAYVRIPRNTGLGRAFHDVDIVPRNGKKFLTIPADARTYGRSARDFPEGTFEFKVVTENVPRPSRALVFVSDGKPAFWLRRKVHQKQDRTLLPSDEAYQALGRAVSIRYITNLIEGGAVA